MDVRLRKKSSEPAPTRDSAVFQEINTLVDLLQTQSGLKLFKRAYRESMNFKIRKYAELQDTADEAVLKQRKLIGLKFEELKEIANVVNDFDNWNIFQSISEQYFRAQAKSAQFQQLKERAMDKMRGTMAYEQIVQHDIIKRIRDEFVASLKELADFAPTQPTVVGTVVEVVSGFLKDPNVVRNKMMNIMLVGNSGSGKTTIAHAISKTLATSGIFISGNVVECGRADFIGQYEGQTVARTRNFLISNLDTGVIFVDEAYSLTPWHNGKAESYGAEAAAAMVEFMSQFVGLYCIIAAGYEQPMIRYFLGANEGLERRFPYKFSLKNMSDDDLVRVFKYQMAKLQDIQERTDAYFTADAWEFFKNLITIARSGQEFFNDEYDEAVRVSYENVRSFVPTYPLVYKTLFENQAGSMTNLAEGAIRFLLSSIDFRQIIAFQKHNANRPPFAPQGVEAIKSILENQVMTTALYRTQPVLQELQDIYKQIR